MQKNYLIIYCCFFIYEEIMKFNACSLFLLIVYIQKEGFDGFNYIIRKCKRFLTLFFKDVAVISSVNLKIIEVDTMGQ